MGVYAEMQGWVEVEERKVEEEVRWRRPFIGATMCVTRHGPGTRDISSQDEESCPQCMFFIYKHLFVHNVYDLSRYKRIMSRLPSSSPSSQAVGRAAHLEHVQHVSQMSLDAHSTPKSKQSQWRHPSR